jgi:hypothetical protein
MDGNGMTSTEQKRTHWILRESCRPLAAALAAKIWTANHYGFPSASLTTPNDSRTNANPNTPYNRVGVIADTLEFPVTAFGHALTVKMRLSIARDDWFAYHKTLTGYELNEINAYLDRPAGEFGAPKLEHSRHIDELVAWETVLEDFRNANLVQIWLELDTPKPVDIEKSMSIPI